MKNAKPQNRIKKITVGKNFDTDSLVGDWVRMYYFYDILKDMYNYSTFWKLSDYTNLDNVVIPKNFKNFRVESGAIYSMDYKELLWVLPKEKREMTFFTINDKCTSIKSTGFAWTDLPEWEKLKKIKFGKNFKTVSSFDFSQCYSLEKVKFNKKLKEIEADAFCKCINLREVILPAGLKAVGANAFAGCEKIKRFVVKGKKTTLDHAAVEKSVVIIGKKGSQAQKYAKKNGNKFKVLK